MRPALAPTAVLPHRRRAGRADFAARPRASGPGLEGPKGSDGPSYRAARAACRVPQVAAGGARPPPPPTNRRTERQASPGSGTSHAPPPGSPAVVNKSVGAAAARICPGRRAALRPSPGVSWQRGPAASPCTPLGKGGQIRQGLSALHQLQGPPGSSHPPSAMAFAQGGAERARQVVARRLGPYPRASTSARRPPAPKPGP